MHDAVVVSTPWWNGKAGRVHDGEVERQEECTGVDWEGEEDGNGKEKKMGMARRGGHGDGMGSFIALFNREFPSTSFVRKCAALDFILDSSVNPRHDVIVHLPVSSLLHFSAARFIIASCLPCLFFPIAEPCCLKRARIHCAIMTVPSCTKASCIDSATAITITDSLSFPLTHSRSYRPARFNLLGNYQALLGHFSLAAWPLRPMGL